MNILEEIFRMKRLDFEGQVTRHPADELEQAVKRTPAPLDFRAALTNPSRKAPRLIAELKRRTPSKGFLGNVLDPAAFARTCYENGAAAISVITEERYFDGSLRDLETISAEGLPVPLLRKDFLFDRYHLLEARAAGASAVLLIAAALPSSLLEDLAKEAIELELTPLVEIRNESDLERALSAGARVIGVNNRDLQDFSVNLSVSLSLGPRIPADCVTISESGIRTYADLERLAEAGFDAVLVGEALMRAGSGAGNLIRELSGIPDSHRAGSRG
jgi:indole-3-glycerol phosphate synthase